MAKTIKRKTNHKQTRNQTHKETPRRGASRVEKQKDKYRRGTATRQETNPYY